MEHYESKQDISWNGYLTLVRHGSTDMNEENRFTGISDPPLNKKGIEQAKKSAEFLFDWALKNKIEFDLILTSPLKRCLDTANEFKRLFGLEYVKEILLTERNYGIFESLSHKEAAEKYPELFYEYQKDKPFITLPNGESGLDIEKRVEQLLFKKIPSEYHNKKEILIISHLNPIRAFFRLLGLADWDVYFKPFNNASISRIKIQKNVCIFEFCDKSPLV